MTKPESTFIVGLDFSECGKRALESAILLAKGRNAVIHIAHAVTREDVGIGSKIERQEVALEQLPRTIWKLVLSVLDQVGMGYDDMSVSLHVRLGSPVDVIKQVAIDYGADLVIVGTHGRTGVKKMILGSVAETLARDGRFPVLIAHENRLKELVKTARPDEPLPEGHVVQPTRERTHIYRSSLISAWAGLGQPTRASL